MKLNNRSRRKFISGLSKIVGAAAATSLLAGNAISVALAYTANPDTALTDGKVFDKNQLQLLQSICAIVIPITDTPGAAEVDTHGFIDNHLFHCYENVEQEEMRQVLLLINSNAEQLFSQSFLHLNADIQFQLLTDLDRGEHAFNQTQRSDFKTLKQLICFGYYTSEAGATQELRYDPVPGEFKGSIPYKSTDAAWATGGLFY